MQNRQMFVEGELVELGERMFWPGNRIQGRFSGGSGSPVRPLRAAIKAAAPRPSPNQVRARVRAVLKRTPQVMVKITGGGRGMGRIRAHLEYISRKGELELEDQNGELVEGKEGVRGVGTAWKTAGKEIPNESSRREAFNIMLSMPPDTDVTMVRDAAREFAAQEFSNHLYVFSVHRPDTDDKTERPHVHLVVRAEALDGRRLNPRKADLQRWRETFAQRLQARGVAATAERRHLRGIVARARPRWQKSLRQRGGDFQRVEKPLTTRELQAQRAGVASWHKMATLLADSDVQSDRTMAVEIAQMVSKMPAVVELQRTAAKPLDRTRNEPGRDK